eukprot:1157673-Pelagomonas_calceolata.AAC.2
MMLASAGARQMQDAKVYSAAKAHDMQDRMVCSRVATLPGSTGLCGQEKVHGRGIGQHTDRAQFLLVE